MFWRHEWILACVLDKWTKCTNVGNFGFCLQQIYQWHDKKFPTGTNSNLFYFFNFRFFEQISFQNGSTSREKREGSPSVKNKQTNKQNPRHGMNFILPSQSILIGLMLHGLFTAWTGLNGQIKVCFVNFNQINLPLNTESIKFIFDRSSFGCWFFCRRLRQ